MLPSRDEIESVKRSLGLAPDQDMQAHYHLQARAILRYRANRKAL